MTDDDALIARVGAGDARARDALAKAHLPFLVRRDVPGQDAEDVAERAMVRALERLAPVA